MTAPLRLGYGTNGFSDHRLDDALAVIAELGYTGVGLTLDHHHLDPFGPDLPRRTAAVAARLAALGLGVVVETGARYLLDPSTKHHPTLVSDGWPRRVDFLVRAVRIAADLDAECVSFWSGVLPPGEDPTLARDRMLGGIAQVLSEAATHGVRLGLEPEPGHVVATLADALAVRAALGDPGLLGVTLDVGHCVAVEPVDAAECIRLAGDLLVNVQLDDMLPGVHEHLEFGTGALDLPATLAALVAADYRGLACVELPRHSHAAPLVARRALAALTAAAPRGWLDRAVESVRRDPASIGALFPAVGREVGRGAAEDAGRARLLGALSAEALAAELPDLYRYGDAAEKLGVLRALAGLAVEPAVGLPLVADALRTNDTRLVAAAMGEYAAAHLDPHAWRHGVLKCVFVGVPLAAVARWRDRADAELRRMAADFAEERRAAGRAVPTDVHRLLEAPDAVVRAPYPHDLADHG